MTLAVAGLWSATPEVQATQRAVTALILPALLFLLMVNCDLRAILAVGPRVLAVFACAMVSILLAIIVVYLLFRDALPAEGWKMLAALSATWTGGSANLVAVKQSIGLSESSAAARIARRCTGVFALGRGVVRRRDARAGGQSLDAR